MWVRAQRRVLAAKGNDFGQRRRAVGISDVATQRRIHHIATAPQVMERIINTDLPYPVLVGQLDTTFNRVKGNRLAQFQLGIPNF